MDILNRKPIWLVLSDFYLDNELQDFDFDYIASKIMDSPYSLKEIKAIDKEEIFPVLYPNLLSVAGNWSGFQEDWLVAEITKKLQKKSWFSDFMNTIRYVRLKWMFDDHWKKLEAAYQTLKARKK